MLSAIVTGLASGAIYALVAVGLVLVFKGSRVLNLAQGELGAFSYFSVLKLGLVIGLIPADVSQTSIVAGLVLLIVTVLVASGLGIGVERLLMRRLVERPAVQGTIVTLGLAVVLINVEALFDFVFLPEGRNSYPISAPSAVGGQQVGLGDLPLIGGLFEGGALTSSLMVAVVLTAAIGVALWFFFGKTRFGLGVVAATSDNTVARILGIPVVKVYRFTWGVGGALAGLAAVLAPAALLSNQIQPGDMTLVLVRALAAAVVGGLDSINGAIAGGLLLGVFMSMSQYQFPSVGGVENLAVLVLVIGTLMLRPRGLMGGAGAEVS